MTGRFLVEVPKDIDTNSDHDARQKDESVAGPKKRPIAREIGSEERKLRNDQERARGSAQDVIDRVEEEELDGVRLKLRQNLEKQYLGDDKRLDQHYDGGRDYREECDDVHPAEDIKYDISRAGQGLAVETHCAGQEIEAEVVEGVVWKIKISKSRRMWDCRSRLTVDEGEVAPERD